MSFGVTLLARRGSCRGGPPRFGSFVVEKDTPGFTMGPKMRGIGWRGLDTRELYFDDVWVARRAPHRRPGPRAEPVPGHARGRTDLDRRAVAQPDPGGPEHGDGLCPGQRNQFGRPISKFQAVQFKLADIATELEAARWLTYRAAYLRDTGQPFLKEAAMAKLKASRVATSGGVRGRPDPWGDRLHARVPGCPLLLRFEGARDRGRNQRDTTRGDRARVRLLNPRPGRGGATGALR